MRIFIVLQAWPTRDWVFAATTTGMTVFRYEMWTLEKKALHLESLTYPQHDRFGLIAFTLLKNYGERTPFIQSSDDNDGLWYC